MERDPSEGGAVRGAGLGPRTPSAGQGLLPSGRHLGSLAGGGRGWGFRAKGLPGLVSQVL